MPYSTGLPSKIWWWWWWWWLNWNSAQYLYTVQSSGQWDIANWHTHVYKKTGGDKLWEEKISMASKQKEKSMQTFKTFTAAYNFARWKHLWNTNILGWRKYTRSFTSSNPVCYKSSEALPFKQYSHALLTASAKLCWLEHGQPQPLLSHQPTWRELMVWVTCTKHTRRLMRRLCRTTFSDAQIWNCINPFPAQWTSYDVSERTFTYLLTWQCATTCLSSTILCILMWNKTTSNLKFLIC